MYCEDNVRIDLNELGVNTTNWIGSAQDPMNAELSLGVP